ncbi:unnamed protein product [Orchesella dallaii]|uniref:WH2 domain-containing protein n=1 Tax=Orchesella dallaii TaxID=48710 RepID=A0ABP1PRX9_9HEXA
MNSTNDARFKGMAKVLQAELTSSSPLFRKISTDLKSKEEDYNGKVPNALNLNRSYSMPSKSPTSNAASVLLPPPPSTPVRRRQTIKNDSTTWHHQIEPSNQVPARILPQKPTGILPQAENGPSGMGDMKRLQGEMAMLKRELAAMSDLMKEDDEWLQRSSAEVKELAREQKKFENLTSQQFKSTFIGDQKKPPASGNGYHVNPISPPPLPKSPRPNLSPIKSSTIKKYSYSSLPPQTSPSLTYHNGYSSAQNNNFQGLKPSSISKHDKTTQAVQNVLDKVPNLSTPNVQPTLKSTTNESKSISVKNMSSIFESNLQSNTTSIQRNNMQNRRETDTVTEFRTKPQVHSSKSTAPQIEKANKVGKLPFPLSTKPGDDSALKNVFTIARERPPLSPKPVVEKPKPMVGFNSIKHTIETAVARERTPNLKRTIHPNVRYNGSSSPSPLSPPHPLNAYKAPLTPLKGPSSSIPPPPPSNASSAPPPPPPLPNASAALLPPLLHSAKESTTIQSNKDDKVTTQSVTTGALPNISLLMEEIRQFKKSIPDPLENIGEPETSEKEHSLRSNSDSGTSSPSHLESSKGTFELLQEIREFKKSQSLRKVSDESAESTPQRRRKNSMHDALQTRFQAFCGGAENESSSEDELDDFDQWDD